MDFVCFLLVNAVLYIRPAEFIPALREMPLYEIALAACLLTGLPRLLGQVTPKAVTGQPVTAFVLFLMAATVLSNVARGQMEAAGETAELYFKVVLYYLLMVAIIDTRDRLIWFLAAMALYATVVMGVSVLDYHGYVSVPGMVRMTDHVLDTEGELVASHRRMGSTGLFADPNDVCMLIDQNLIVLVFFVMSRSIASPARALLVGPVLLLGHALTLSQSRGGFLALIAGLVAYLAVRFGRRAVPLGALCLPVIFVLFGGRQTALSTSVGTGQQRIQIWMDYLTLFRRNPVFGIGCMKSTDYIDHVAHNSFIHSFAELGFGGGVAFLGAFAVAFWSVKRLAPDRTHILDPELARLRPYVMAVLVCYVIGMMSLSRAYAIPTYNVLGLAIVYARLARSEPSMPPLTLDAKLVGRVVLLGVLYLILMTVYTQFAVRY